MTVDWDHVYLLGWYGRDRHPYYSSWQGEGPMVRVLVTGCEHPPLGRSQPPAGVELREIPTEADPHEYAAANNGIYAFGWYYEDGGVRDKRVH